MKQKQLRDGSTGESDRASVVCVHFVRREVQVQSVKRQDRQDARDVDEDDSGDMEAGGEDATGKRFTGDCES